MRFYTNIYLSITSQKYKLTEDFKEKLRQLGIRKFLLISLFYVRLFVIFTALMRTVFHQAEPQYISYITIVCYAVYNAICIIIWHAKQNQFFSNSSVKSQFGFDSIFIMSLYAATRNIESDFFIFFVIPIVISLLEDKVQWKEYRKQVIFVILMLLSSITIIASVFTHVEVGILLKLYIRHFSLRLSYILLLSVLFAIAYRDNARLKKSAELESLSKKLAMDKNNIFKIFNNSCDIIIVSNKDGYVQLPNKRARTLLNYGHDSFKNVHCSTIFCDTSGENGNIVVDDIMHKLELLNKSTLYDYDTNLKSKDNKIIHVKLSALYISSDFIAIIARDMRDIDNIRLEKKIAIENEEAVKLSILDALPLPIIELENRIIKYSNDQMREIFGLNPDEIVGENTRIMYQNDSTYVNIGKEVHRSLLKDKVYTSQDYVPFTHSDGTIKLCKVKAARVTDNYEADRRIIATYEDVTELVRAKEELSIAYEKEQQSLDGTISIMLELYEQADSYTKGHQMRVSKIATAIAKEMNLDQHTIRNIQLAASLHDIGKISIPISLLCKPGSLTEHEFSLIKQHPVYGFSIFKNANFPLDIAEIALQHHEKLDGSGYPNKLRGEEIKLEAQIISISDVFEAMCSARPYRTAYSEHYAIKEIIKNTETSFKSEIVDAFLNAYNERRIEGYNENTMDETRV